jgi:hypothetical protein
VKDFTSLLVFAGWICGIVIAKGFWSTFFAVTVPPYAFYLVAEKLLTPFL